MIKPGDLQMRREILDQFGKLLIENVRDVSISEMKAGINNTMQDFISQKIHKIVTDKNLSEKDKLMAIIPFTVDTGIHYFLWMIENNSRLQLIFDESLTVSAVNLKEISDGLSGEIFGKEGWINRFSKEEKINY